MSLPRVGTVIDTRKEPTDQVMWSVTTILKVLNKEALLQWAVNVTAERVIANLDVLNARLANEGPESAISYVKGLRWQTDGRLTDTELGTLAHGLFEAYALLGVRPEIAPELHPMYAAEGVVLHPGDLADLAGMVDQFDRWLQGYQPDYLATEVVVYHPKYGYAGQADGFVNIAGNDLIVDYKTSRKTYDGRGKVREPYAENALQLSAYRHATHAAVFRARRYTNRSRRYYLLSDAEKAAAVPVPEVVAGLVVKITPDHLGVYPLRCDKRQHDAFLFCQEVARWLYNEAPHVVGNLMDVPHPSGPLTSGAGA